jgi:hypothetical protein
MRASRASPDSPSSWPWPTRMRGVWDRAAIRYSGTQETTSFNEESVGTAVIVDLGDPLTCQTINVGTWLHARVSQEVASEADLQALRDRFDSFNRRDRTIIRYDLHGQVTISQKAKLDEIIADYETVFASLEPSETRHDLTVVGCDTGSFSADETVQQGERSDGVFIGGAHVRQFFGSISYPTGHISLSQADIVSHHGEVPVSHLLHTLRRCHDEAAPHPRRKFQSD